MSTATLERVYGRLPVPLQHVAVSGYGLVRRHRRLGGRFRAYRQECAEREWWPAERWRTWQRQRLREVLELAWAAPASRRQLAGAGLTLDDCRQLELADLERVPALAKDELRRDPQGFCAGGAPPRGAGVYHSSGSSGTPVTVYFSNDDFRRSFALRDARYAASAGVDYSLPRATFSGRRVSPDADGAGPFHRYNAVERQVYLSPYHLGPATAAAYVAALRAHRPAWLTGYAGSIALLARLALEQGLECPPLRAVITAAEPVPPSLREDCPRVFGCPVTEEYGLIEQAAFALECPQGSLHVSLDAALVEILDEDGRRCQPGEVGEIVGTSFLRTAQPLLRYRTGDLGALREGACACGRETPILESLEGRVDDVVATPDGRRVGRLSTVPKNLPGLLACQFVQERADRLVARVVCDGELLAETEGALRARLRERLGSAIAVEVEQVGPDALERTARGKIRGLVSRLPRETA